MRSFRSVLEIVSHWHPEVLYDVITFSCISLKFRDRAAGFITITTSFYPISNLRYGSPINIGVSLLSPPL